MTNFVGRILIVCIIVEKIIWNNCMKEVIMRKWEKPLKEAN
jgi:hypothetical protein